jgi:excisionase family DNA binding protein
MPPRQLRLSLILDDEAMHLLTELLINALGQLQSRQAEHARFDEKKAARLRASQNVLLAGHEHPTDRVLLLDTRETARLLGISERTVFTMEAEKRMPKALRLGKVVRWSYDELKEWIAKGCPAREK